ncbi:MAG TPA: PEP-CTERM sorting domain-containing protein [Kiritimatiellia bacterium]|nr:PEP-CTERM sorting domain-containing protein [Kiritimatiellia bacterium]
MRMKGMICAVALLATASAATANLLYNPGFNTNGGGGTTPDGWTATGDAGKQGVENWGSHDGDGWLEAFYGWNAGTSATLFQNVAGAANSIYTLSFWQEGDDAWNGTAFSVSLLWLDATGSQIGTPATMDLQSTAIANTGWTNQVLQATSPLNTATVRVQFAATSLAEAGAGAAKIDEVNFDVQAIPEPSTLALVGIPLIALAAMRRRFSR